MPACFAAICLITCTADDGPNAQTQFLPGAAPHFGHATMRTCRRLIACCRRCSARNEGIILGCVIAHGHAATGQNPLTIGYVLITQLAGVFGLMNTSNDFGVDVEGCLYRAQIP